MRYNKQYSTPDELVQLLKKRGLVIEDEKVALQSIRSIGYYRLSAYLHPFSAYLRQLMYSSKMQH